MKKTLRTLSILLSLVLCIGVLGACGGVSDAGKDGTKAPANNSAPATDSDSTEPFVAPPDQIGVVVSADTTLVTWNSYTTEADTIDFMKVDVEELGDPAAEMSLVYLEGDVTYYAIEEGKLTEAESYNVLPGCVIGVTTLEEGVQEVYILYTPSEYSGADEFDYIVEEPVDVQVDEETPDVEEDFTPDDAEIVVEAEGDNV